MSAARRRAVATLSALGLVALSAVTGCSSTPTAPLPTVAQVDLARYAGGWYEIAALPNPFQSMCVADTKARYQAKPGGSSDDIAVFNRCRRADGTVADATGIAKVTPDSGNARLRVSFFRPFYGDYWVLALPDDYRWVLVGEPGRRYAWLLARTPQLPAADVETALARAAELGFDRAAFKATPQTRPLAD